MADYPEHVQRVDSEFYERSTYYFGRSGSNDYSKDVLEIVEVVDSSGQSHRGAWTEDWTELGPGILTRKDGTGGVLRVHRSACPVRVLFHKWSEHGSWDGDGPSGQTSERYWTRFEA